MKKSILNLIDFFYPVFKKVMPLQTFRYAACGGTNMILSTLIFIYCHKFVFKEEQFNLGFYAFKSYNVALFVSSCCSFIMGFIFNRYLVFTTSYLRGHIQLFRYFLSFCFNLFINYVILKVLVEHLNLDAVLAQLISTCIVVVISYLTQSYFTFKVKKVPNSHIL